MRATLCSFFLLAALRAAAGATAAPQYFISTYAGYTPGPPAAVPIALNQYLGAIQAIACNAQGVVYYATSTQVFRLNADGTDTLIAGNPSSKTFTPGEAATGAPLGFIAGLAFDAQQNLYIANPVYVFKVSQQDGTISIFAGNGSSPGKAGISVGPGIPATSVPLSISSIAIGGDGTVYVATGTNLDTDFGIVSFTPDGANSALLLGNVISYADHMVVSGTTLYADFFIFEDAINVQSGAVYQFPSRAWGYGAPFAIGLNGMIYGFASGGVLVEVNPVTDSATPVPGAAAAQANGVAVNPVTGDLLLYGPGIVEDLNSSGKLQTIAGFNFSGDNGPAVLALLQTPTGLAADASGNLYILDGARIRKVTPSSIITTIAGTGVAGSSGDGGKAIDAEISAASNNPYLPLAIDQAGDLYFVNSLSQNGDSIREIAANGAISTIAGGGTGTLAGGAMATGVTIEPAGLAVDPAGDVYFAQGSQVWEIVSGQIMLVAGKGKFTSTVTNATPAVSAGLGTITGLAADGSGNLYIGDSEHYMIFEVNPQGMISLLAGMSVGDDGESIKPVSGPATSVNVGEPEDLVVDAQGNLYFYPSTVVDYQLAMVDTSGNLTLFAGTPSSTASTSSGDGGNATLATFGHINALAVDAAGSVYVADGTFLVRKMPLYNPDNPPPFINTGGVVGAAGSLPPVGAISTGGIVSIFGSNFVGAANQHTVGPGDLVNGKVPTTLVGVCVSFGGSPAAMLGVYPSQLNVQIPALTSSAVTVQVTVNCGTGSALTSNFSGAPVQAAAPEFFSFKPDPVAGNNPISAVNAVTGAYIGPPGLLTGATFAAANPGDIVQAYGAGWGPTSPSYGLGVLPGAAGTLSSAYSLTLGGVPVPAADILYAGISPCCAGLYQIDFTIPSGTAGGNLPLVLTVAGEPSPPNAFLAIQ